MGIGKKEAKLAIILGVVLYLFFFYKVVWTSAVPSISEINDRILGLVKEKASLEEQYKNIDGKRIQLTAKTTLNERMDEYLMNSANLVDCLEYVDKLASLVGQNVSEMNIGKPEERYTTSKNNPIKSETDLSSNKKSGQLYYESKIGFKAYMSSERAMQLIQYVEGGTQKVRITKFSIKPLKDNKLPQTAGTAGVNTGAAQPGAQTASAAQGTATPQEKLFEIDMTVSLYSLNILALDRMFEYNRHKLNQFMSAGGVMFENVKLSGNNALAANLSPLNELLGAEDIVIKEQSYLTAGENLQIFGVDRENDIVRLKTDKSVDVAIRLNKNSYRVSTRDSMKKVLEISGPLPDKELVTMNVTVDMPLIAENKNIRLNITVVNDSGKKLNVSLDDRQNRVKINNRKGKAIFGDDSGEHVNIL